MEPQKMNVDLELADLFLHNKQEHQKVESPWCIKIRDINQKTIILVNNRLVATPKNSILPEHIMTLLPNPILDSKKRPVFMGLNNRSHILSCVKSGEDLPRLKLVRGDIMDLYKKNEESMEFTFYIQAKGSEITCCFESAAYPGWFLSTSPESNRPLGLSQRGGSDIILFYFERKMGSSE
ncbi:interleukin-36 receptor antagonist protein-like [Eublepharis macularius]|uniref:Interleukin-1 n=1 Tax=Eublepharis macularius TaxID=481883 RepID=A0AA97KCP8_EUBMA|nr:interleukin-36 receptor antagonist protein-like [Eublepharis macularius]